MDNKSNYKKLIGENKIKEKKLKGEYKTFYKEIRNCLIMETQQGEELQNALSDILDILIDGIQNNRSLKDLFPDGKNRFINDMVSVLPKFTPIVKLQRKKKKQIYISVLSFIIVISIIYGVLWNVGYIGVWHNGISYCAGKLDKYSYQSSIITDEYSVEIDLNDLNSNIGKVIYNDKSCTINIYEILNYDGNIIIWFRSHGTYSLSSATLVSALKHTTTENRWFTEEFSASLTTEYNGEVYKGDVQGANGFYKDGDTFGYFLIAAYDPNHGIINGSVKPKGIVKVTLTNLCINTWNRK